MSEIPDFKNHVMVTAVKDIRDICTPLFEKCYLNYFHYRRTYLDGSFFVLCTNSDWQLHFFSKGKPIHTPLPNEYIDKQSYYALWSGNIPDETVKDARNDFDIDNAIAIVEPYDDYYDSYSFASPSKNYNAINFYLNNTDVLRIFILYFKDKADELINLANESKIHVPAFRRDPSIDKIIHPILNQDDKQALLDIITPKKYKIKSKLGEITLTNREFQCFKCINRGMTSKEIGKLLKISSRTAEGYIDNIKIKSGCTMKSELLTLWQINQLDFLIN